MYKHCGKCICSSLRKEGEEGILFLPKSTFCKDMKRRCMRGQQTQIAVREIPI